MLAESVQHTAKHQGGFHHLAGLAIWKHPVEITILFVAMARIHRIGDPGHVFGLPHVIFTTSTSPHQDVVSQVPGDLVGFRGWRG